MNYIYYAYLVISAALIPILNNFYPILKESYSWWLIPVLLIGFFFCFVILQVLLLVVLAFLTDLRKPANKNQGFFRYLISVTLPFVFALMGIRVNMSGKEKLPCGRNMLIVCNHQHNFDPAIMLSQLTDIKLSFIGKKEIYTKMPLVAKAMHRLQSFSIDRENDREAAKTVVRAIRQLNEGEFSVVLFPEGYTSKTCELLPYRNGSFKIALKSSVPIAVCAINNTRSILKNMFLRSTPVDFEVIDVIEPETYAEMNTNELSELIRSKMLPALLKMQGKQ